MSRTNRPGATVGDPFRDIADQLDNPPQTLSEAMRQYHAKNPTPSDRGISITYPRDTNDRPAAQRRGDRR